MYIGLNTTAYLHTLFTLWFGKKKTANNVFTPVRLSDSEKNASAKQNQIKSKNVSLISEDVYNVLPHGLVLLSG